MLYGPCRNRDRCTVFLHPNWQVRISAHALADDGQGETPLIPEAVVSASQAAASSGVADPAEQLSRRLLHLAQVASSPDARSLMSPRVMQAILWALAR